ncbi:hypothetical protein BC937DRAFT_93804 [Endogone sp. FLAS-F59071]|nr:hypothetical protein BC937DRAFT_93804 [Endogone sp. FLAS-F59071]|eukprot:RUS14451.1 hypothetical protein BC937DRAFT_93804 [Endogone sp. FLAS-F59071]
MATSSQTNGLPPAPQPSNPLHDATYGGAQQDATMRRVDPSYEKTLQNRVRELLGYKYDGPFPAPCQQSSSKPRSHTPYHHLPAFHAVATPTRSLIFPPFPSDHHNSFPGAQPVSFETEHLQQLETEDYFACEKSDGLRYLLFALVSPKGPATFLIDRKNILSYIPHVFFPMRDRPDKFHNETLMDGELVTDVDGDKVSTGVSEVRFELDIGCIENCPVLGLRSDGSQRHRSYAEVLQHSIRDGSAGRHGPVPHRIAQEPRASQEAAVHVHTALALLHVLFLIILPVSQRTFRLTRVSVVRSVELKKMERCYGLHIIFDQIPKLHHASDGVVFTPVRLPYIPGTSPRLWVLKWKPADQNTVDFRINVRYSNERKPSYTLSVAQGLTYKHFDHLQLEQEIAAE